MALNDNAFKAAIIAIQDEMKDAVDYDQSKEIYAEKLVLAVKQYIMSGTVTTTVATTGSATAQTGTGTGTIS
jgi:hypothetical protein